MQEEIFEKFLDLHYEYLDQQKKKNPNMDDTELSMNSFPMGWYNNNDYEMKIEFLNRAMKEGKSLLEYDDVKEFVAENPFYVEVTPKIR